MVSICHDVKELLGEIPDSNLKCLQIPVAKTAINSNFLLSGSSNLKIGTIGRIRIEKSEIMLNMPVAKLLASPLRQ